MRIDKEKFNQLKQLDRIEYLLTLKRIEGNNSYSYFSSFSYLFFFIFGFLILTFLGVSNLVGIERATPILIASIKIFQVGIFIMVIGLFIDIVFGMKGIIERKKLVEKYFKVEVKK